MRRIVATTARRAAYIVGLLSCVMVSTASVQADGINWTSPACDVPLRSNLDDLGQPADSSDLLSPDASQPSLDAGLQFSEQSAAFAGDTFAMTDGVGGYIDNAVLRNRVRLRYDYMEGINPSDRAEYLSASPLALGGRAGQPLGNLKYQEIRTYVEWKFHDQVSVFAEFPVRMVDNAIGQLDLLQGNFTNTHNRGAGDINAGLRYALWQQPGSYLTGQVRVYMPTGDAAAYLGTGHAAIEAGLLFQHQRDRLTFFGQVLDWQASGAGRFSLANTNLPASRQFDGKLFGGNVLQWGVGMGYDLGRRVDHCCVSRLTLVMEVVGWNVLDGLQSNVSGAGPNQQGDILSDATGDTIVNGKYGLRYTIGCNSLYAGYGTAWTSDWWYTDMFRLEFGHNF
jgi:hypothetical protein